MATVTSAVLDQPLLVLFAVLTVGTVVGAVRVAGTSVGPAGALFAGIAAAALIPTLADVVPPLLGTLGLALFVYTIGLAGGPAFLGGLRRGAPAVAVTVATCVAAAVAAWGIGGLLGLDGATIAGVYAGAGTNSSGLAAAIDIVGDTSPAVGYAVTYPFGIVGFLLAIPLALGASRRRPTREDRQPPRPAEHRTVHVTRDDLPPVGELIRSGDEQLIISRVRRHDTDHTPDPDEHLRSGDLVTVVGSAEALRSFASRVGGFAAQDLVADRRWLDVRRVVVSNPRLAGRRIAELDLDRFDAVAAYVRRGDVDVAARDDLAVELGDRIRVIAPRDRLAEVSRHLGDSERAVVTADPVGFSLGLALGFALALVPIPLPTGTLTIGPAIGPLVVGLLLGARSRTGPIVWQLPYATNQTLRQIGALLFLGVIGLQAGPDLAAALRGGGAVASFGLGVLVTTVSALGLAVGARLLGAGGARTVGTLAGGQGQPAILEAATDRTGGDDRVALTYALLFPTALIVKVLLTQLLATL